ncbi:hypothetical protein GCM10009846_00070 [Agrococcus versicolor]|uniref:Uncharacterized protein n=1 Tax=Agrococcus versicolor TaxID=501482 RepID=A0ABN3AI88_9MICO
MQAATTPGTRTRPDAVSQLVDFLGAPAHELEVDAFGEALARALRVPSPQRPGDLVVLARTLADVARARAGFRSALAMEPSIETRRGRSGIEAVLVEVDARGGGRLDPAAARRIVVLTHAALAVHDQASRDELLAAALEHAALHER